MAYIQSDKITAFPLAKNREGDRKSNLFYEENIANIVNQLTDTQGFIITKSIDDIINVENNQLQILAGGVFQFSLGGRLFTIASTDAAAYPIMSVTSGDTVYASINIDETGEVEGQDDNNLYKGLELSTTQPSNADYVLPLFKITDSDAIALEESYLKLSVKSVGPGIKIIDGKRPL